MHFDLEEYGRAPEIAQKLRDLPSATAPPMDWQEFKRRQLLRRARARSAQWRNATLAAAVSFVMIGASAIWRHLPASPDMSTLQSAAPQLPLASRVVPIAWDEAAARSAASERWLAALPEEPVIVHVGTRTAVTNLEDRIAWVDDTLSSMRANGGTAERARALQYERDQLVNSLAQVRYAETLAAYLP